MVENCREMARRCADGFRSYWRPFVVTGLVGAAEWVVDDIHAQPFAGWDFRRLGA